MPKSDFWGVFMREVHYYADFPSGLITERTVEAVKKLPLFDLVSMLEQGKIRVPVRDKEFSLPNMTYRNLRWDMIDDYAKACDLPLSFLIYGENKPTTTRYSFFDAEILPLLNAIPANLLQAALAVLNFSYANPKFQIPKENTPSAKLLEIAFSEGRRPWEVPQDMSLYSTDISVPLEKLQSRWKKEWFVFHIDYILDLCTYWRVSPHFIFSLSGCLLCNTPEGDAFFDKFCLLSRRHQAATLAMLMEMYPSAEEQLGAGEWDRICKKVMEEGSVVSCY